MTTEKDLKGWGKELQELAKCFGTRDRSGWLRDYTNLKEKILAGCSLGRYANGLQIADTIIESFGGYEYLATLFARMDILDSVIRGLMEEEE